MESVNAIQHLRNDHKVVRGLFRQAEASNARAPEMREGVIRELFMMLEIHTRLEEEIFYPALADKPETSLLIGQSLDEHKQMSEQIRELRGRDIHQEGYNNGLAELMATVEMHLETEEDELFTLAERILAPQLDEMGTRMEDLKRKLMESPEYSQARPELVQDPNGGEQMRKGRPEAKKAGAA